MTERTFYSRNKNTHNKSVWVPSQEPTNVHLVQEPLPSMLKVAIADDHQIVVEGLQVMLSGAEGIDIVGVSANGRESLQVLHEKQVDVLVTDLNMPGLNGVEMIAEIRQNWPDLKIIVLTMYHDARLLKRLKKQKIEAYLLKNTSKQDLAATVQAVADGKTFLPPELEFTQSGDFEYSNSSADNIQDTFVAKYALGKRELEIFTHIARGTSSQEIADQLFISIETVHSHRKNIKFKTGLKNTAEITAFSVRNGLI